MVLPSAPPAWSTVLANLVLRFTCSELPPADANTVKNEVDIAKTTSGAEARGPRSDDDVGGGGEETNTPGTTSEAEAGKGYSS